MHLKASKMEGGIICRSGARYVLTIKREGDWRAVLAGRKICNARTPLETELLLGVRSDGRRTVKNSFPCPSTVDSTRNPVSRGESREW